MSDKLVHALFDDDDLLLELDFLSHSSGYKTFIIDKVS